MTGYTPFQLRRRTENSDSLIRISVGLENEESLLEGSNQKLYKAIPEAQPTEKIELAV